MKFIVALLLVATNAFAGMEASPVELYSMAKPLTNSTQVVLHTTKDIQGTCNAEKRRRKEATFNFPIDACSFFDVSNMQVCHIYVRERTNNDILGHELRHCFVGHFH